LDHAALEVSIKLVTSTVGPVNHNLHNLIGLVNHNLMHTASTMAY